MTLAGLVLFSSVLLTALIILHIGAKQASKQVVSIYQAEASSPCCSFRFARSLQELVLSHPPCVQSLVSHPCSKFVLVGLRVRPRTTTKRFRYSKFKIRDFAEESAAPVAFHCAAAATRSGSEPHRCAFGAPP